MPRRKSTIQQVGSQHVGSGGNMPDQNEPVAEPRSGSDGATVENAGTNQLVVVGIGASAGGLETLKELLPYLPLDGMAYVVVQHLAPDRESILAELLARGTRMQVATAAEGMVLESGHLYVIPPHSDLAVIQGVVHLTEPSSARGAHLSVDYLFRSLAEDQGESAVGVVLSGTGTDGTLGLKAIKAAGGFTLVQEPSTARYDGMPRSARDSGAADYCAPLKEIGEVLGRIVLRSQVRHIASTPEQAPDAHGELDKLFVLIRSEFRNDLSQYKLATIERRVERRMMLHKLEHLEDYVRHVQQNRDELHALYKDILIAVTSFFRDPEAFEALKTQVLRQLLDNNGNSQPIRVWVPACATGEEAYSIAVCLLEVCDEKGREDRIQIFATDVDDGSIQFARRGIYPANIALDVSTDRLLRFFVKKDNELQVARRVRDVVIFSNQHILRDPPFSHIDLISCRNLLIYLTPRAQKKALRVIHYALNPGGHLFLSTSETVGDAPELFSAVDRKSRIYKKRGAGPQPALARSTDPSRDPPTGEAVRMRPTQNLQALADRKVLELYGPPGVVVSESFEILQFRGRTGPYLDPAPGAASLDMLKVARFELHVELKKALEQARAERARVTTDITYLEGGGPRALRLDIVPLEDPDTKTRCFLVLFHSVPTAKEVIVPSEPGAAGEDVLALAQQNQQLERELTMTKEYLQATVEEKESMLEELKSANEELQSSNEELQSMNEELETSKEEMQSTNEELTTVNDELHTRMTELAVTHDDLRNVLAGVDHAIVIVGMDLRIRRYTAAAEKLFNLVPGDVGRTVSFLDSVLGAGALEPKVSAVIHTLSTVEEELLASNGRWYTLRINPYKTGDHTIRGALVTLLDIDVSKRALDTTRDVGAYAAKFLAAIDHPLLILDRMLRVIWTNDVFLSTFQLSADETVGAALASLSTRQFAEPALRERLESVFANASVLRGYEMRLQSHAGERTARLGASVIPASTEMSMVLLSIELANNVSPETSA